MKGNINEISAIVFEGTTRNDTISPQITEIIPRNGSTIANLSPEFKVVFSELIPENNLQGKLYAEETGDSISVKIIKGNAKEYIFKPGKKLNNYTTYRLKIVAKDAAGNELTGNSEFAYISISRVKNRK